MFSQSMRPRRMGELRSKQCSGRIFPGPDFPETAKTLVDPGVCPLTPSAGRRRDKQPRCRPPPSTGAVSDQSRPTSRLPSSSVRRRDRSALLPTACFFPAFALSFSRTHRRRLTFRAVLPQQTPRPSRSLVVRSRRSVSTVSSRSSASMVSATSVSSGACSSR